MIADMAIAHRVSTETPSQKRQKEVDLAVHEGFQRWSASDAPDWKWLQFSLESDPHLFEGYAPVRTIRAAWREQHA